MPHLAPAEAAAYAAPYPDATFKAGVRRFPNLVPDAPDADGALSAARATGCSANGAARPSWPSAQPTRCSAPR